MASSMLTGDRRWAMTRKSGLTVLGKVPKPINLPSQRLENHGLDPNVEIVPKGTLTWGSRPSLAAPNAWGTPSVSSPNADGSAGSPSHRPSSGGSGTRPSTAGSDRSHEPLANAWGPNSRPSSASGILASSQMSAATRPQSAETRPGSSQLSRFADNSVDSTLAWGAAGTAERLGAASSKSSGFNLSPGDFPSLGSDMNSDAHSQRGHSSQGRLSSSQSCPNSSQERPASASDAYSKQKDILEPQLSGNRYVDHSGNGTVNTWKADNPPYVRPAVSPDLENWHWNSHPSPPYPNINMPLPHYDSWHDHPFHPADGVWYRGGESGGPYRPPGPPANYPPDYPHGPSRPLSNPQFPRQDASRGGFYPNNCESYRPYMPPARYMGPSRPDIAVRPVAYPGPAPFEGYFGPPRPNFYNSTEREASIMGMPRPVGHNQYPNQHQNYDPVNFHARPGGHATIANKEQWRPDQAHETQGQYRVLLKQHDGSEDHDAQEKREHSLTAGSPHFQKGHNPTGVSIQREMQEATGSPSLPAELVSSQLTSGVDGQSTDVVRSTVANARKIADESLLRRPEAVNAQSRDPQQYPVIKKNAALMEKVEGLNNKARIADSHIEGGSISSKEKSTCFKDATTTVDRLAKVACTEANLAEHVATTRNLKTETPKELNVLSEDKNEELTGQENKFSSPFNSVGSGENTHVLGHRKIHVTKSVDHRAGVRSSRHGNDEWMEKPPCSESPMNATVTSVKCEAMESDASQEALEKQELHHVTRCRDGSHTTPTLDPTDHKAQRAKMRETAIQRARQLQQEEEERTREQKAKALAKLEELNRRTLAESSNLKSNHASLKISDVPNCNPEPEPQPAATPSSDATSNEASSDASACLSETVKQADAIGIKKPGLSSDLSHNVAAKALQPGSQSSSVGQRTNATANLTKGTGPDIQHGTIVKQKHVGYRKKHGVMQEKEITSSCNPTKDAGEITMNVASADTSPNNEDSAIPRKKRNNKSAKNNNNNKLDEAVPNSTSPTPPHTEGNSDKNHSESGETKPGMLVAEAISVPSEGSNKTVDTPSSMAVTEETHGRVSNPLKPHHQRKTSRNQQTNKPMSKYHVAEAVMWAPVKPQGKIETSNEVSQNCVTDGTKELSVKSGNDLQNGQKTKRAEIERYVPKPVAKELSQLVSSQQTPSSPNSQTVASGRLDEPTVNKAAVPPDTKHGENSKHSKHGKTNASWRQRSSAESPVEGSETSDQAKIVEKATEQQQPQATNINDISKEHLAYLDDGWNDYNSNVQASESGTSTVVSNSHGANRQRRQPYKPHKVSDSTNLQQGSGDKSENVSPSLAHNVSEGRGAGVEYIKPYWQPKTQTYRRENKVDELPPPDVGYQGEQAVPLGVNQRGQNTGRFQRSYDLSYRGRDVGQDASKQNFHIHDGEKRKSNNRRVGYQRIGSYDKPADSFQQSPNSHEGAHESSRVPGSRYRGQGRNFLHRGGGGGDQFHGWGTGASVRAGDI